MRPTRPGPLRQASRASRAQLRRPRSSTPHPRRGPPRRRGPRAPRVRPQPGRDPAAARRPRTRDVAGVRSARPPSPVTPVGRPASGAAGLPSGSPTTVLRARRAGAVGVSSQRAERSERAAASDRRSRRELRNRACAAPRTLVVCVIARNAHESRARCREVPRVWRHTGRGVSTRRHPERRLEARKSDLVRRQHTDEKRGAPATPGPRFR